MENLPAKIKNLYELKKMNFDVPCFFIVDKKVIEDIDLKIKEIINYFQKKKIKSVIIRSASMVEDLNEKSNAGFFESSDEIKLEDFDKQKILYFWKINKEKTKQSGNQNLFMFVQEYFNSDYSGVLFTQTPYEYQKAILSLSFSSQAITDGKKTDMIFEFNKKNKKWNDNDFLSEGSKKELVKIVYLIEKKYPQGADLELGIRNNKIKVFQARPITRNKNEKILLSENKRLKRIFKEDFDNQVWEKNAFVQALGDLSPLSLSFYKHLLNSEKLQCLLYEARIINRKKDKECRILENIGGNTYFNSTVEKELFSQNNIWWKKFINTISILSFEKVMQKKCLDDLDRKITIEEIFSWLFLSGIYVQIFSSQEKQKYKPKDYIKRLKNTEFLCNVLEPRINKNKANALDSFIKKYYYLADCPYDFANTRISEQDNDIIMKKYGGIDKNYQKKLDEKYLNKKVIFWLEKKIIWKKQLLKYISQQREMLIGKYGEDIFNTESWIVAMEENKIPKLSKENYDNSEKLSEVYSNISGENYPFPIEIKNNEEVIVPGNIDFENIVCLKEIDNIENSFNQFIAISIFPSNWIPFIPKLKGIILKEGNELSHMAITCREFEIPCKIIPSYFKE